MTDIQTLYIQAMHIVAQQSMDPELASPEIKIEPIDSFIHKAVQELKKIDSNYFVGVRKIVVDTGSGYGFVQSGPNKDPAVIHINLSRIKSELQSKLSGASKEQFEKELVRQVILTIAHERGHIRSFKPDSGFTNGEQPAEAESRSIETRIK